VSEKRRSLDVDVAIVGAGVVGCSIAARLSQMRLDVCVLERRHDVADETSKSNTGVADSGWECVPGSLEAEIITRSSPRWEEICDRLDVPFRRCGGLSIARDADEERRLDEIVAAADANRVRTRRLDAGELRKLAPYVVPDALGAVEVPDEGVIDSIRLTLGYAELAARNGVIFCFGAPVVGADVADAHVRELYTPALTVRPGFVVNAAGLGADAVAGLLGAEEFTIWPRRGEYLLVDREVGRHVDHIVTQLPNEHTRGVMVVPATHHSLLLGPTADDDEDKFDRSTHGDVLERVLAECRTLVPDLRREDVIKSFAGLRPASERTYRIEPSEIVKNLIHACGIRSTGVSGSPGIADHVHDLLVDAGLSAPADPHAVERIPRRARLSEGATCETMAGDPLGRTVVCACEKVTAREIHDALSAPLPARSITGVAKRTRATWGRCQGAACLSGVSFIASQYLAGPAWALPFGEPAATLGVSEARRG
jgi:glycerol-3-phosphate dehydrogenase